ncbi:MAG: prolyl oligopeptidase family serine peptidase [Candidatus Cybelea sp.]
MYRFLIGVLAVAALLGGSARAQETTAALTYPSAPSDGTFDSYYGTRVPDPYRPLENLDSPATVGWIRSEAALTRGYLDAIPQRAQIATHLRKLLKYEAFGVPFHMRGQYFYLHNAGLQDQYVLYTMQGLHGTPRILIDPNAMSSDGSVTLGGEVPSWNARLLAYMTQTSGSDWETWHVRNVASGRDLPDVVHWSKFSNASWLPDSKAFFYERYPQPKSQEEYKAALYGQGVYEHVLGTPQSADSVLYYRPEHRNWLYDAEVTEDGHYVVLTASSNDSINDRIGYADLSDPHRKIHELLWKNDAQWSYVGNVGPLFYFTTTLDAPNTRVVTIDLRRPGAMRTLVPQSRSALSGATDVGGRLILSYLTDAHSAVKVYDRNGRFVRDVALPGVGTATGFPGYAGDRLTFYRYAGWTTPGTVYSYDVLSGANQVYRRPKVDFDSDQYVSAEIFYRSKDGTRVPMTISYRKGLARDGRNPTILYGYGGFDIAITPYFSSYVASWLQMGGVYAVANVRGGSEYGETWHEGGMLGKKQNVFDDFIAAAQYLIDQNYTSTPKLAIKGESNGGLLVGAVEAQRPDLFGAALAGVGVMDALRFDKFTIGNFWAAELGCATCGKPDFDWLYAYSPYANIKPGTKYPATLVVTSDHDDRVFPAHSYKFTARMQAAQAGPAPILLRVQQKAGHGESTTLGQTIDLYADMYAFLVKNLGMTLPASF